jgi:hypothetical protein
MMKYQQITCAANVSVSTDAGVCEAQITIEGPATGDNCSVASVVNDYNGTSDASDIYPHGETTIIWTITDGSDNTNTCSQTVTVTDDEAPTITCAADQTQNTDAGSCDAVVTVVAPTTADNCGVASVTNDYNATSDASGLYPLGETTIIWTITDGSDNATTCSQTILVVDNTNPTASAKNITISLDASGSATIDTGDIDNGSSDNCDFSLSLDITSFDCDDTGDNTVTLTATDDSDNEASATAIVTVVDDIFPTAVVQDITISLDASGSASIDTGDIDDGSSDNCGFDLSLDITSFDCDDTGDNTVTLTATDDSDNVTTATAIVTVVDDTNPTVLASGLDLYLDENGEASITIADIDNGSSDNCAFTLALSQTNFDCDDVGANDVTLTATDASDNESSLTVTVMVIDNIPPALSVQDLYFDLCDLDEVDIDVDDLATYSDACGIASAVIDLSHFTCMDNHGDNTVTVTITDNNGNITTLTANVEMDCDNTAPSCPTIDLVDAEDLGTSNTDNVTSIIDPTIQVIFTGEGLESVEAGDEVAFYVDGELWDTATVSEADSSNGYVDFETWSLDPPMTTFSAIHTDECGYSSTVAYLNIVLDTVPPVVNTQDVTLELDADGSATVTTGDIENGSTDDQPGLVIEGLNEPCNSYPLTTGALDVWLSDEDDEYEWAELPFFFNYNGADYDSISVSSNGTIAFWSDDYDDAYYDYPGYMLEDYGWPLIAAVNTDLDPSVGGTIHYGAVGEAPNRAYVISWNAVANYEDNDILHDAQIVLYEGSNVVEIYNGGYPSIYDDMTIGLAFGDYSGIGSVEESTASHAAGLWTFTPEGDGYSMEEESCHVQSIAYDCGDLGGNTVTLVVTDFAGNQSTGDATVTVVDAMDPTAVAQNVTVHLDENGDAELTAEMINDGSSDNCGVSISLEASGSIVSDLTYVYALGHEDWSDANENVPEDGYSSFYRYDYDATDGTISNPELMFRVDEFDDELIDDYYLGAYDRNPVTGIDYFMIGDGPYALLTYDIENDLVVNTGVEFHYDNDWMPNVITFDNDGICYGWANYDNNPSTIVTVDLATGETSYFADVPQGGGAKGLTYDYDNNRLLIGSKGGNNSNPFHKLGAIDIATGDYTSLHNNIPAEEGPDSYATTIMGLEYIGNGTCLVSGGWRGNDFGQLDVVSGEITYTVENVFDVNPEQPALKRLFVPFESMGSSTAALDCADVGTNPHTLYVTDPSGNMSSAESQVTVVDDIAPVAVAQDVTIQLDENGEASTTADAVNNGSNDACGVASVTLSQTAFECGELGGNAVTLTVTDVNGNVSTATATVTVEDLIDPVATMYAPADFTLYAGESCINGADLYEAGAPWYEATDNCENDLEVEIAYAEVNDNGGTAGCREFDRQWTITVTDAAGNTATDVALQHITISDLTAPAISLEQPADVTLELDEDCSVDLPAELALAASASDNCTASPALSALSMSDGAATPLCDGGAGSYSILRTYSISATDDCGNTSTASVEMTITVLDLMAPQITDAEGLTNGQQVDHDADAAGILDFITLPDAATVEAVDFCDPSVEISLTQNASGAVPTDDVAHYCAPSTPAAQAGNMACTGAAPNAIVLEGAFFGGEAFNIDDAGINMIEVGHDEHLEITLSVSNADNTGGFTWTARYNPAWTWAEWLAEARSYKKDCADIMPGETPWEDWYYFIMSNGSMSGTGMYAGSNMTMTHQPLNYYYGFQVGAGANNQNDGYGASAWFYWSGEIVVDGVSQGQQASSGDVAMDLDCALPWSLEHAYTATDDCGNETFFTYTDAGTGEVSGGGAGVSGGEGHTPYDITTGVSGLKDPIRITGLMPNPTSDIATLGFVVVENMRIRIDLYTMSGVMVQALFDGTAGPDQQYLLDIDASGLGSGMYQIRISSSNYMTVKKLLVTQ